MNIVIYSLSILIQLFVITIGLYHILVGIFAYIGDNRAKVLTDKKHRFAMVVAAHNEEQVVAEIVDSLVDVDYDKDLYDIFVIADNCNDSTAEIARQHGADVHERFSQTERGKGYALNWMFERIFKMEKEYDAICVFDADNIVHKNFLKEMNVKFNQGYKAVQGYIDTKNPNDTWITASYAISFWFLNKVYQSARSNLGLSNQITGTGFAVATSVIKEYGWSATCLAEDMEFTMQLVLSGISVGYAKEAIVYDEKPLTLVQSFKQRTRWMQGHADVASRFIPSLFKKAVKEKDILAFDCIIYLLQPTLLILLLIITTVSFVKLFYPQLGMWFLTNFAIPPYLWNAIILGQFLLTPIILFTEGKLTKKMMFYYIPYMLYAYTWLPIAVVGVIRKNNKEWSHTKHTRKIAASELNH